MCKRMLLVACLIFAGCTEQQRARRLGGTAHKSLPPCQKLVTITWKENDLWILTRPSRQGEPREDYQFSQDTPLGIFQGAVVVKETAGNSCPSWRTAQ